MDSIKIRRNIVKQICCKNTWQVNSCNNNASDTTFMHKYEVILLKNVYAY